MSKGVSGFDGPSTACRPFRCCFLVRLDFSVFRQACGQITSVHEPRNVIVKTKLYLCQHQAI
jgi:hypothetical protein